MFRDKAFVHLFPTSGSQVSESPSRHPRICRENTAKPTKTTVKIPVHSCPYRGSLLRLGNIRFYARHPGSIARFHEVATNERAFKIQPLLGIDVADGRIAAQDLHNFSPRSAAIKSALSLRASRIVSYRRDTTRDTLDIKIMFSRE